MPEEAKLARVFSVQRMSTEDGPGIRTTVFFEGCTLACDWCHNPESISARPRAVWHDWKCLGCGSCLEACQHGAIHPEDDGMRVDAASCHGCRACSDACPTTAMEPKSELREISSLLEELRRDRAFYDASGGGVTLSGGEPTAQAGFTRELLRRCQDVGLHTALDTCGNCGTEVLASMLPHADLVLYDLKLMDEDAHRRHVGQGLQRILDNLVAFWGRGGGAARAPAVWIRTPLVPGTTATTANMLAIGRFLSQRLDDRVERWELCAFNNLCQDKYQRLGMTWSYEGQPAMDPAHVEALARAACRSGVDPSIVHVTGGGQTP